MIAGKEAHLDGCRLPVCAVCLVASGVLASTSTSGVRHYILFAAFWMVAGGFFLMILLPALAPVHQSAKWVFLHFDGGDKEELGIPNDTCESCPLTRFA